MTTYFVGDGLGKATMLLLLIPLLAATIGWAGATPTARSAVRDRHPRRYKVRSPAGWRSRSFTILAATSTITTA